jgi:hypothetical protein
MSDKETVDKLVADLQNGVVQLNKQTTTIREVLLEENTGEYLSYEEIVKTMTLQNEMIVKLAAVTLGQLETMRSLSGNY